MKLTPVDFDPFSSEAAPTLTPVDFDPFEGQEGQAAPKAVKLTPVEGNPFEEAPKAPEGEAPGLLRTAGDVAAQAAGGLVSAAGNVIRSGVTPMGPLPTIAGDLYEQATGRPNPIRQQTNQAAEAFDTTSKATKGLTTEAGQRAQKESTPEGVLWDPSTWTAGKDPSARGYLMHGADLFGQMLPLLASSLGGAGAAGGAVLGGMMGSGAAKNDARDTIDRLAQAGKLEQESAEYRRLLASGMKPEDALERVKRQAEEWASAFTTPISALGGAATGKILDPATHLLSTKGLVARTVGRATAGAVEEGTEEVAEGVATRAGTNVGAGTKVPLGEGTFGEFVLGALGGGPTSGAIGALTKPPQEAATQGEAEKGFGVPPTAPPGEGATLVDAQQAAGEGKGPVFYSQVKRVVEEKGPSFASPEQWEATIRNAPGVKEEEVEALGLPEYLHRQGGRVSKADVLAHIEENQIDVGTIVRTNAEDGPRLAFSLVSPGVWQDELGEYEILRTPSGRFMPRMVDSTGQTTSLGGQIYGTFEEAQQAAQRDINSSLAQHVPELKTPRYEEYSLPGGSNYSELQLTLPEKGPRWSAEWTTKAPGQYDNVWTVTSPEGRPYFARGVRSEADAIAQVKRLNKLDTSFRSSHWEEPDVLAHVRGDERRDAEGKRTFFVQEIQSDWHQTGRKEGYKGTVSKRRLNELMEKEAEARRPLNAHSNLIAQLQFAIEERDVYNRGETDLNAVLGQVGRLFGIELLRSARVYAEAYATRAREQDNVNRGVPNAPFKTSWSELAVKRILRWAADNGYERIAFASSAVPKELFKGLNEAQQRGQEEFYDRILPNVVQRWARKLGGTYGKTVVRYLGGTENLPAIKELNVPYVDITPEMASRIQHGLPTFMSRIADAQGTSSQVTVEGPKDDAKREAAVAGAKIVYEIAKRMGITKPLVVKVMPGRASASLAAVTSQLPPGTANTPGVLRAAVDAGKATSYLLRVWPDLNESADGVFSSMMHELGHIISFEHLMKAPKDVQVAVEAAYQKWLEENRADSERSLATVMHTRATFLTQYGNVEDMEAAAQQPMSSLSPERYRYFLSKVEWIADQTAKWLLTSEKPMSVVERFFSTLAKKIRVIRASFAKAFGIPTEGPKVWQDYLDSIIRLEPLDYEALKRATEQATQQENQKATEAEGVKDFPATPRQPASPLPRRLLGMLGLLEHPGARSTLAAMDRFNGFYRWMLSLVQVADRNPHIGDLQQYRELWQVKKLEESNIQSEALETRKAWRALPSKQRDSMSRFIDDYMNMEYLSATEIANKTVRRPTPSELAAMAKKHGLSLEAINVFRRLQADFDRMLDRYAELLRQEAAKILDPVAQTRRMLAINEQIDRMRNVPYMPAMRFGDFTLTIRDAANKVIHFETFESEKKRAAARKEIERGLAAGEQIFEGVLPKEARPFMGLPSGLLDLISEKLTLTAPQKGALEQLRYELAPAQSFRHRLQRKGFTPGYSLDFERAYANYMFFGAKYFTDVKYIDAMRERIKNVRDSAKLMPDGTKRGQIANFLSEHLNYTMDPRADWAIFRSLATLWALGFVPAAATLNLSQLVVGSYPFLASKFGDLRATAALLNAGRKVSSYYKRGTLDGLGVTDIELRAISEGVKEGIITEAMAPELAAATEADNLSSWSKGRGHATFQWVMEKAMWMFQMTEQMNRRVTFRAAWALATKHPDAKFVKEAIAKHSIQFARLRERGWTEAEAASFVAAKDAVESTQYIYSQWAHPKFMRGKARTVFMFKNFLQNTLFMMYNHPTAGVRAFLIMALLGGMMGAPGAEDLRGIIKAIAWQIFGKDFDIEEEARRFVIELLDGKVPPDLILHGAARRGFGVPHVLEMLGLPGGPVFDRSKAMGLGQISPVDIGLLLGPSKDRSRAVEQTAQRASGAAFSAAYNIFKGMTDAQLDWNDSKRWQQMMPRALANVTKSMRYYAKEEEVNRYGNRVVRFDTQDPQHLMEIVGSSLGYQPMRLAAQWDRIIAEREAIAYWDIRRQGLMRQLWAARGDDEAYQRVLSAIRKFNVDMPDAARGKRITADAIRQSFQARERARVSQEGGTPTQRSNVPLVRDIQRLYPEAQVDVRTVR